MNLLYGTAGSLGRHGGGRLYSKATVLQVKGRRRYEKATTVSHRRRHYLAGDRRQQLLEFQFWRESAVVQRAISWVVGNPSSIFGRDGGINSRFVGDPSSIFGRASGIVGRRVISRCGDL